jgi:hypothetical protein
MACHARLALIEGQELLLWIKGFMVHGYRREDSVRQGLLQGNAIGWSAQGRNDPPALGDGIEAAAIRNQMPPAHGGVWSMVGGQLAQQGHPFGRGEIHQLQSPLRMALCHSEQALQRQGFTDRGIGGPACAQGFHAVAHHTALTQTRVARSQ